MKSAQVVCIDQRLTSPSLTPDVSTTPAMRSVRSTSSTRSVVCRTSVSPWMTSPPVVVTSPAGASRPLTVELLLIGS